MKRATDLILGLRGWAALAVVFAMPALEPVAFLGIILPGELAVVLGGVLAFQGRVALPTVMAVAIAGTVVGDSTGYLVGSRWGARLLSSTVGRFVKGEHLDRARGYLGERGRFAILFGRYVPGVRVLIPSLAGMSPMPYRTFALYNVPGGVAWAVTFVLVGYIAGSSWRRVEHLARRASVVLLLVVVVVVAVVALARWLAHHPDRVRAVVGRVVDRPRVARVRARYHRELGFLAGRFRPSGALGLWLTVSLLATAVMGWFMGVLVSHVLNRGALLLDRPTLAFFRSHREPWLTGVMWAVTTLGSSFLLVPLAAAFGLAWRWRRGSWRPLELLAATYGGGALLQEVVKVEVGRARPPLADAVAHFGGFSFPSGHAVHAVVVWGTLAGLAAASTNAWPKKVGAWAGAGLVCALVGLSRLYLGAHWLSDVGAGLTLGALWLSAVLVTARTTATLRSRRANAAGPPPD